MKEFEVTFNVLADNYEQAVKISEPICKYFLADSLCTLGTVRLKHPEQISKIAKNQKKQDKGWFKSISGKA